MCAASAEAFAPSFMGQGLGLRQAKSSSALSMKIELAPLPYDYTALEPKIGKQTLEVSMIESSIVFWAVLTGQFLERRSTTTSTMPSMSTWQTR